MSDDYYMAVIIVAMVPVIEPYVCVVGVDVEACPFDTNGCVSSRDDISLSALVSHPSNATGSFPVTATI